MLKREGKKNRKRIDYDLGFILQKMCIFKYKNLTNITYARSCLGHHGHQHRQVSRLQSVLCVVNGVFTSMSISRRFFLERHPDRCVVVSSISATKGGESATSTPLFLDSINKALWRQFSF